jgi:hypothetical protein
MMRIVLDEEDFRELVAGRVARPKMRLDDPPDDGVEIILSDIGWDRMMAALYAAAKRDDDGKYPWER